MAGWCCADWGGSHFCLMCMRGVSQIHHLNWVDNNWLDASKPLQLRKGLVLCLILSILCTQFLCLNNFILCSYCPVQSLSWRPFNHPSCPQWVYQPAFLPHCGCSQQVSQGWPFRGAAGLLWSTAQQSWRENRCSQPRTDSALDWLWGPPLQACGEASG